MIVLVIHIVLGRRGLHGNTVLSVERFEIDRSFRHGIVNRRSRELRVFAGIAVRRVADHDALDDDVIFDLLVGGVRPAEFVERDFASERLPGGALQQVELDGDSFVPAVGKRERHGCRTRNLIRGIGLGSDDQFALFAVGIHDLDSLDPPGVLGIGIFGVDRDCRERNVGGDDRLVLAPGSRQR